MSTTAAPAVTTTTTATSSAEPAAAAAPAQNTLASVLSTAIASVRSRTTVAADLTTARAQLATVTAERDTARTERDQARTDLTAANARALEVQAQLNAIGALFGVKPEELAGKDAAAATAIFSKKISDATIEQVAGLGFPVAELPKQTEGDGKEIDSKLTGLARVEAAFKAQAAAKN